MAPLSTWRQRHRTLTPSDRMDVRTELETMDPAVLGALVRRALRQDDVPIGAWRVTPLSGGVMGAPIFRVTGIGAVLPTGNAPFTGSESGPWSLVVKQSGPPPTGADPDRPEWNRAVLAYQAKLLPQDLPQGRASSGLVAAQCLGTTERPDGTVWLWTEDLTGHQRGGTAWSVARYALAARHLGQFNAVPLVHASVPQQPWLHRNGPRWWVETILSRWTLETIPVDRWAHPLAWAMLLGDVTQRLVPQPETWEHPRIRAAYPVASAERILALWKDRFTLLNALTALPQTLCHGDPNPGNLFARTTSDGHEQTVAVDWDLVGLGAVGEDAGHLLSTALLAGYDGDEACRLQHAISSGYLAGLADRGWRGDERHVRYALCVNAALHVALIAGVAPAAALGETLRDTPFRQGIERFFGPIERKIEPWAVATCLLLDLVDEARRLLPAL